jgi:hypothetical protein
MKSNLECGLGSNPRTQRRLLAALNCELGDRYSLTICVDPDSLS